MVARRGPMAAVGGIRDVQEFLLSIRVFFRAAADGAAVGLLRGTLRTPPSLRLVTTGLP